MPEDNYALNSKFEWRFSGYTSQQEAENTLEEIYAWFRRTFNENEWQVTSSVMSGPYGWAAELNAKKTLSSNG